MGDKETLKIISIGANGVGIARRQNGKVCMIPFTLPDELCEIKIVEEHQDYSFGKIVKILEKSPNRIEPECKVFEQCGGCNFLHTDYQHELKLKKSILLENLFKIAKIKYEDEIEVLKSEERFRYRNNVQIKTTNEGEIGFYANKTLKVVPFFNFNCLLLTRRMQEFINNLDKKFFLFTKGFTLRDGVKLYSAHLNYETDSDFAEYIVNNYIYRVGISDFFQVNNFQLDKFQNLIFNLVEKELPTIELYGGVGFFSLPISKKFERLKVNELSKRAVKNGIFNSQRNNINNIEFIASDALAFLKTNHRVKQIIADPPRDGMTKEVVNEIINSDVQRLIYISCNSATFSRDFSYLAYSGFKIEKLFMIDNFPNTYHVELTAVLSR